MFPPLLNQLHQNQNYAVLLPSPFCLNLLFCPRSSPSPSSSFHSHHPLFSFFFFFFFIFFADPIRSQCPFPTYNALKNIFSLLFFNNNTPLHFCSFVHSFVCRIACQFVCCFVCDVICHQTFSAFLGILPLSCFIYF